MTVIGTRFEQQQIDEPVPTTVITADEIVRSGARTLVDVLALQTGIQLIDNSGNPNKQIDMRGFGMTGDQNTLILLDGQRLNENELASADLASIPISSVERIEILRGNGSVLYGRGTAGGTINIVTKKNQDAQGRANAALTIGSYGTIGTSLSGSISRDRLGLNVFVDRNQTENYRLNNKSLQENLTTVLTYRGDRGPVSLRLSSGEMSLRLPGERNASQLSTDPRGAKTPENFSKLDTLRAAFSTEQKFDWGFLGLDVSHRTRDSRSFFKDFFYLTPDLTKVNLFSLSPRLKFPFETGSVNHSFIVGTDWDRWNWNSFSSDLNLDPSQTARQDNVSLYLKHTANFPSGTSVAVGLRRQNAITKVNFEGLPDQQNRNLSAYEVALRQDLEGDWSLHAKTGTSYRLQVIDEWRSYGSNPPYPLTPKMLEPQTSNDFDVGLRYQTSRVSASLDFYKINLRNEIMYYAPASANINLPPTERQGIEVSAKWQANSSISMEGGYGYTDARFISGTIGGVSVAGGQIPLVSRHKAKAAANWMIGEHTSLILRTTYSGEARLDNDQENKSTLRRPAFFVADFLLLHQIEQWRFRFGINNLTDERYFTYGILGSGANPYNAYPAMRRSLLATAERSF